MNHENFIKDHLWIAMIIIIVFSAFVAYVLNKNTDPSEDEDEDNTNENSNNYDQDTTSDSRED